MMISYQPDDRYPDQCSHLAPRPVQDTNLRTMRGRRKTRGRRSGISGMKKRKLSQEQMTLLEMNFGDEHKLESQRKDRLAAELGLDPRQVAVWFQNKRTRYKRKKLEEEYLTLRAAHENIVFEKCLLEAELLNLKDCLVEAEKEIQRLSSLSVDNRGSMDVVEQSQLPGDYAYDNVCFMLDGVY